MVSPDNIKSPRKKTDSIDDDPHHKMWPKIQGLRDTDGFPIFDEDYYGIMGAYGFYDNNKIPKPDELLTHDIDTTTALHFYDTSLKKTPIDPKAVTTGGVGGSYKKSELYNDMDFSAFSTDRIKEKTHRILTDPARAYQAEALMNMRARKKILLENFKKIPPLNQLLEYTMMSLNVNTMLLERITDVLDYQEKQYVFEKQEAKPQGKNFYAELTLIKDTEATHIDFQNQKNNKNVPAVNTIRDFPNHNLLSLTIAIVSGSGNVYFATNKSQNSLETTVKLVASDGPYLINANKHFVIESLNIRADTDDTVVKLIGLY